MRKNKKLLPHQVTFMFPEANESEYELLFNSIKLEGQREPIIIYRDRILDGRARYKICQELNIKPVIEEWNQQNNLIDFVASKNIHKMKRTLAKSYTAKVDKLGFWNHIKMAIKRLFKFRKDNKYAVSIS